MDNTRHCAFVIWTVDGCLNNNRRAAVKSQYSFRESSSRAAIAGDFDLSWRSLPGHALCSIELI